MGERTFTLLLIKRAWRQLIVYLGSVPFYSTEKPLLSQPLIKWTPFVKPTLQRAIEIGVLY